MLHDTSAQVQFAFGLLAAIICCGVIISLLVRVFVDRSWPTVEAVVGLFISGVIAFILIANVVQLRPQRTSDHARAVADIKPLGYTIDHLSVADEKVTLTLGLCQVPFGLTKIDGKWSPSVPVNAGGIYVDTAAGKDLLASIAHTKPCQ